MGMEWYNGKLTKQNQNQMKMWSENKLVCLVIM